eukprot:gnl/MRDRNA2_/MRDRNA2_115532_c0_seq1.p1 gnl/MRDRNA2_/MRDRNA2_115532_c0~~gnl/MRDRNA2_/MRDRNA2_115532_c0_seq1.p1  ORF type:complete len:662 (-),score=121.10 gnl/MRDRNA2_/MRDRNA2_115532_c0_seq1:22-2007(-)
MEEICRSCRSLPVPASAKNNLPGKPSFAQDMHNYQEHALVCSHCQDTWLKELTMLVRREVRGELQQFGETWLSSLKKAAVNEAPVADKAGFNEALVADKAGFTPSSGTIGQDSAKTKTAETIITSRGSDPQRPGDSFTQACSQVEVTLEQTGDGFINNEHNNAAEAKPSSTQLEDDHKQEIVAEPIANNMSQGIQHVNKPWSSHQGQEEKAASHHSHGKLAAHLSMMVDNTKREMSKLAVMPKWVDVYHQDHASCAAKLVKNPWFDSSTGFAILINAGYIGYQADWAASHLGEKSPESFRILELMFCVIFTCELALKIYVDRKQFIFTNDWAWNFFDVVVVGLGLMDQITSLVTSGSELGPNLSVVRVLRVIRLIRIVRVVRVLRFFRELRMMLYSVVSCLKSLVWAVLLVFMMIYIVGIFILQLVTQHREGLSDQDEEPEELVAYYSSIGKSMLTLYMAISGGIDWGDVTEPLAQHISPAFYPFFALYIAFAVLALLNVITGVFVEKALASALDDRDAVISEQLAREESYANEVRRCFHEADEDGSGTITWKEFEVHLNDPRVQAYFKTLDIDASEVHGLFKLLDMNEVGEVGTDDFVMGCMRLKGQARSVDLATLMYENKRIITSLNGFVGMVREGFVRLGAFPVTKSIDEFLVCSKKG